ncbi:hypothetical protein [Candidatus Albibeggiatoa sp. nov. BB20]|uniref:hypothetical protein n=1 Tax=Candidatus Albibeggiatoa sp. nov. BB20 TaxID=3162723 RepID=UPI0033658F15
MQDVLNQDVLSLTAYMPLAIPDVHWILIAKIDEQEIHQTTEALQMAIYMFILICASIVIILALFFSKSIAGPITKMTI